MPNEATNNNNGNNESRADEAPYSFLDDPIQDMVNEGDHDEPGDSKDGVNKKSDKNDSPISPELQARLDKMEDERAIDRQTVEFLKGQNSILESQLRGGDKKEEVKDEPLLKVPSKEALQKALTDPDTAVDSLVGMFEEFGKNILERINKVDESGRTEHQKRDQHARWQSAMAQDRQEAIDEFGEDTLNNKEFIAEADKEMERVIARRGGRSLADVQPGDFSAVAARVHSRWLRAGKLDANANNSSRNGNNDSDTRDSRRPTLREISREVSSDRLGGNGGGPRGSGGKKTMADLYPNDRDLRIADAARKRMGVSEEAWVRSRQAILAEENDDAR